jgi:hypothetical protein
LVVATVAATNCSSKERLEVLLGVVGKLVVGSGEP